MGAIDAAAGTQALLTASGEPAHVKDVSALDASRGLLVLLIGLPAVGKSTLSRGLSEALGASVLDRDQMVRSIYPEHYAIWTRPQVKLAGEVCGQVAQRVLLEQPGARLIIDGFTFSRKSDIDAFVKVGQATGTRVVRVHCVADEKVIRKRIEGDGEGLDKRRDWIMYTRVKERFEPLEKVDIEVDLTSDPEGGCKKVLDFIEER